MKPRIKPSLWWIAIAPFVLIAGVGSGTTIFLKQANRTRFTQTFTAPTTISFKLNDTGTYILSHNYSGTFRGRNYEEDPQLPEETGISLQGPGQNSEIAISLNSKPEKEGGSVREIGRFSIKEPGRYELSITGFDSTRVMTFSQSVIARMTISTLASILLNLLGWFGGPAIVILVMSARIKDRRRLRAIHPELFEEEEPLRG